MPGLVEDTRFVDDLLPNVIDLKAKARPDDIWAEFPVSDTGYQDGFRSVTYAELANAINGAATWLLSTLGAPKQKHEVIAYVGPNDLRAPAMILGAAKAGYVVCTYGARAYSLQVLTRLRCS
jgi:acyl-CoA synthetase (AMP-forming)/AMP-acid ligase II